MISKAPYTGLDFYREVSMMNSSDTGYLIDIASQSQYQNPNDEYHKAYTEWRMNEHNRYGYKFVKDVREHTYVEGEGFQSSDASDAERNTLKKCSSLIGGTLLIAAIVRLIQAVISGRLGNVSDGISMQLTGTVRDPDMGLLILQSMLKPISFILCILIFQSFVRLPKPVFFPKSKAEKSESAMLIIVFCGLSVIGFALSSMISNLSFMTDLSTPGGFVWTNNMVLNIHCFVIEYVVTAALHALFLNGFVLQFFRQFGDSTAIVITIFIETIMALNIANVGVVFLISLMLANITIKTGSVMNSFIARVLNNIIVFSLKYVSFVNNGSYSRMLQLLLSLIILLAAIFCIGRLMGREGWTFRIINVKTELKFTEKMKTVFTSMPMIIWLAASVIAWLYIYLV